MITIDDSHLDSLKGLRIKLKTRRRSLQGFQVSRNIGEGIEFEDYREYCEGDDVRNVDWFTVARLRKYFVKRYVEEEAGHVVIFIDCSSSMNFGAVNKFRYALELALGFSLVSLAGGDRLSLVTFNEKPGRMLLSQWGLPRLGAVKKYLSSLSSGGITNLAGTFNSTIRLSTRFDLMIVLTDMLTTERLPDVLPMLRKQRSGVAVVIVSDKDEFSLPLEESYTLIDSETRKERAPEAGPELSSLMRRAHMEYVHKVKNDLLRAGMLVSHVETTDDKKKIFLETFRRGQLLT
jgi:uncharacterized protein (DUF58 family)